MSLWWSSLVIVILSSSVQPLQAPNTFDVDEGRLVRGQFGFTRSVYNASVPENSLGSTLVLPTERMGLWNEGSGRVKLEIVDGDPLKLFRVEEKQVGIFCFLILRVNNNERSLNREFKDVYKLRVKGTLLEVVEQRERQSNKTTFPTQVLPSQSSSEKAGTILLLPGSSDSLNLVDVTGSGGDGKVRESGRQEVATSRTSVAAPTTVLLQSPNVPSSAVAAVVSTTKVARDLRSGSRRDDLAETSSSGPRRSGISKFHHYLDLASLPPSPTTERQSFFLDLQSWSTYGRNETWRDGTLPSLIKSTKLKSSKEKVGASIGGGGATAGRKAGKALRRNLRDERRSKGRNKSKNGGSGSGAGESLPKRKNRKEKQILSSVESSHVPIPITIQTSTTTIPSTTTTSTTLTPPQPPKLPKILTKVTTSPPQEVIKLIPVAITECTVYITILDQPDNGPLFEQRTYDMSVLEDIPILSKIAKIVAVDADIGKNQEIYYSLAEWNSHFAVDPILGILSPTRSLIGMVGKRQHIRIQARNRWSFGPAAESTSIVTIRPANRHTPQILINRPPQVETRPYGVIYAVISCRDNDEGPSGIVDLTIKEGDPNGIFRVLPAQSRNEFYIVMSPVVAKSLNLNFKGQPSRTNTFNLTLRAQDRGPLPSKSSEKELQLKVWETPWLNSGGSSSSFSNSGGAQPLFDKDLYEVEISESSPPQTLVFRFPRPHPKVTLSISSGNEGEEFKLERSGVLYTSKWLDFERKSIFTLTVDSLDLRPPRYDQIRRHRSAVKIVIKLIDENKFWPIFDLGNSVSGSGNRTEVFFAENEPMGTLVTRIHAQDYDQGENGYVTYSMANLNNPPFSIDHFTGEVRSLQVLDYETSRRTYVARIRATDWGLPFRRESEMKLQISLVPVNDNRPLFIYSNCVSVIDRRINFETEFGRVVALDFDHDPVTYKIVHGNSDACFSVDSNGALRVMCDLRDFRSAKRVLNLTAGDGEYFSDVMSIKIELRDSLRTNFNKSEPSRLGIKLYSTSHSVFECLDTGVQERYDRMAALSEENNKVDETNLDEENRFPALPSHYTENTQPQFLDFPNEIRVNESVEVGSRVLKLKAVDRDKGYNAFLKFVISSGDESHGAWDITSVETSSWTGATVQEAFLVLARPLDREEFSSYTLNISLFDQGKPPRTMSKLLPIKILDANDQPPIFLKSAMKIRIREGNELVGETIAQVKADDEDEEGSSNSLITYRLVNETFHNFSIDGKSGKVRLLGELDREKVDRYEILIVAEDSGQPRKSSTAVLTVLVDDVNDSSPKFLNFIGGSSGSGTGKNSRVVKVREDWPLYSVVTRVLAEDPDLGEGGIVRYGLVDGGRGDFLLDEVSGVLRVNRKLDYQRTSMYNLTIQARDLGTPSHSVETFLVVEIYDVPESQPRLSFPELVVVASIKEGAPVGSLITTIAPLYSPQQSYSGIYFSLEGTSQFLFSIDSTGSVRTVYDMDYEAQPHWHYLTVQAQSSLDMTNVAYCFLVIELQNENDCVPLSTEPMYLATVEENLEPGVPVLRLQAFDCDNAPTELRFNLRTASSFFEIDLYTGLITTTASLDRETQSEHTLDIIISDTTSNPTLSLNSSTKVIIRVQDENDHIPRVLQFSSGSIYDIPELKLEEQDDEADGDDNSIPVEEETEYELKWSDWRMMDVGEEMAMAEGWRKIFRVVGHDPDAGLNGTIQYRLKYRVNTGTELRREDEVYSIHPQSGEIYTSAAGLKSDTVLKFVIEVADNNGDNIGSRSETELTLRVKSLERAKGSQAPILDLPSPQHITVTTREKAGYTVETVECTDPDGDQLWYEIVSGDPEQYFIMFPDSQNLILARSIPNPSLFKLNISVTDGYNFVFSQLFIQVIESNEDAASLMWEQQNYTVAISESTPPFSVVTTVRLNTTSTVKGTRTPPLYGFHNAQDLRSLRLLSIDSVTGTVRTMSNGAERIDRETIPLHILTVKARDLDTYTFVRLLIHILDENDKAPVFGTSAQTEVRIPETMAVGSLVTQVFAYDGDFGDNGIIKYFIVYGNIGNTFEMDVRTGRIYLRRQLNIPIGQTHLEYQLTIRASDSGTPPLSATTTVTIIVTLPSDNHILSLRCDQDDEGRSKSEPCGCTVHILENSPPGTYITTIHVLNSVAGVSFEIEESRNSGFWIDSTTGTLLVGTGSVLDREVKAFYDFLVKATNAQGVSASCRLKLVLDDENDSVPMFTNQLHYEGYISEDAALGTLVLEGSGLGSKSRDGGSQTDRNPLVFRSIDYDTGRNAIVSYSFVEDEEMRTIFYMDPSSGALLLVTSLDYEKRQFYNFHVRVCDFQFCDPSPANVTVRVENVNDQEPIVSSAQVELLLPTLSGVTVHVLEAVDPDGDELKFNLLNSEDVFEIDERNGRIVIRDPTKVRLGKEKLEISVSDGRFIKMGTVTLIVRELEVKEKFGFTNQTFETSFIENSTKIENLLSLPVTGTHLNENLQFTILNPSIYFGIMKTSGVVITTGIKLDREDEAEHVLLVEVRGDEESRRSRCFVKISVTDVNDVAPFFLNVPYIAVVLVNSKVGDLVIQVKAADLDINENGLVRYELVRSPIGDIYDLNKQTGEIFLRRSPEVVSHHELIVKVYDLGLPSLHAETQVQVKVVTHDQPVFEHQFYETWLPENAPIQSTALALTATAKHPVFFSIEGGNELDLFGIDYQTGTLFVNGPLDFETTPIHLLKVKAKDLITTFWSSTMVQINLRDANNHEPKTEKTTFVFHVVEGFMPPKGILGRITTSDGDEGVNALLNYEIEPRDRWQRSSRSLEALPEDSEEDEEMLTGHELMLNEDATTNNRSVGPDQLFAISPNDGIIFLKQVLDYEYAHEYYFSVIVRDSGIPSLSATTRVIVNVVNRNDNAPFFSKPLYLARLSEDAPKGHTVAKVSAVDLDNLDTLRYAIAGDYHKQIVFEIDKTSGIVTLLQPQILQTELRFLLNISVTDGVFTSYTRLQITIQPKNHIVPTFDLSIYEVLAPESSPEGFLVTTLTARDTDRGIFGQIHYSFSDTDEPNLFQIDERNGQVRLSALPDVSLDREYRESHTLQVVAQDGGKWIGYTKLVVKVEKRKTSPTFPVSEYRVTIPFEKMKTKSPILQVVAIDSDSEFGIRYSIEDLTTGNSSIKRDSQYFEINGENGDLRFRIGEEDLPKFGKMSTSRIDFQFWVRADDGELHSLVPVMVVVLPDSEPSPEIYPQNATFFLKEDASVGSIVTTFRVSNIQSPKFRVVSSNEDLFQVDPNGNLILSALLDQDEEDKHTVVVWAQNSDQGNVATSQVTIRVLATFSNKPKFSQQEYHLSVAEDFPEGSLVFTARAVDSDKGGNIKERYELYSDDPESDLFHFGINQEHGWITLLNRLDYEKHRQHTLRVVASDSDNASVTSATTVVVNVLNVDDEPTLFDSGVYYVEVREDIPENSVIKVLRTVDLDEQHGNVTITSKYLDFYIVAGDANSHFKINELAEISVWRKLDAEVQDRFELTVLATDGKNLDYANVTIRIIDVNDNVPVCPIPEVMHEISEASPNSSYVTVVEAFDPDKDAQTPLFYLSGPGSENFRVEPSGVLSVWGGMLDRETKSSYNLIVHARDREESSSECRIRIKINLKDENDCEPIWRFTDGNQNELPYYKFSLKEDSAIGTFVGKVSAQDADVGSNGRISYSLISSLTKGGDVAKDQFDVEKKSGVISLLRPLDRELIAEYNLTLRATDAGSPPLSATIAVIVQVSDINDNPPEFLAGSYSVAVSESTGIGTEVITVRATSKDEGINAEVRYDIVGGNGYFHWAVDPKTGIITSNASLDYERIREYILTVRARDGPPDNQLASQCTVNISIIDINDNQPQFSQESHSVSIPEDLGISSSVIKIMAADLDTGLNAEISYRLGYGDPMGSFRIHPSTGTVFVASVLDREMIPYYTIEIIATDHGTPPKSSSCILEVQILDVNDSPPLFSKETYTAIVQEDRLVGFKVIVFEVSDADSTPNSTPFSWDLKSLEEEEKGETLPFTVSDAGALIVAGKLNFLRKSIYKLQLTVFDNGTPPLESKANVTIQVVDKSQWPPVISSLSVTVVTLGDTYPPGVLGVCHASDFDSFDVLTYSLLTTKSSSFFTIDNLNGTLYNLIPLREGTYELGVVVSDGRWSARNDAYVKVISLVTPFPNIQEQNPGTMDIQPSIGKSSERRISKEMNSFILMSITGHNRQSLLNRMSAFKNVIKEAVSIDTSGKNTYEVLILSVQSKITSEIQEADGDYSRWREKREVPAAVPAVDVLLSVKRLSDGKFMATEQLIQQLRFAQPQIEGILSAKVTDITADICRNSSCDRGICKTIAIFEGTQSLITTETLSLITPNHKLDTVCNCPMGYGGSRCEIVVNACAHSECEAGLICVPDESEQGYACLCAKMNCVPGSECDEQCSQQSVSFSGTSILSYNVGPTLERELSISLRIKTLYTSGTLVYSAGEFDYAILEINQGLVQFSWDLGTGKEVLTVTSISVSDNRWHRIVLQLRDSFAILRVNERSTQRQKSQGLARILHTNGIFHIGSRLIGSVSKSIETQISSQGFVGCMMDLRFGFIVDSSQENTSDLFHTQTQEVRHYINTEGRTGGVIDPTSDQLPSGVKETKADDNGQTATAFRMNPLPLHVTHLESSQFKLIFSRNISFSCAKIIHFVEACRSLPCKNGGTCHADSTPNGYACNCHPRFHGLNCEIDLEPCGSSPCLNNGICRPTSTEISFSPSLINGNDQTESQFYCQCADDGTYGFRCQSGKYCKNSEHLGESEVCNHRGECEDGPNGAICWCESGYTGNRCQFDYDECKEGGEKVCGPGSKCVNFLGGFRCLCPSNASGVYCQKVLTTPSIVTNDYQIIALIVIIVLAFIVLLLIFICIRRCCQKRRRNGATAIPLTTSQVKIQDNRINGDNREQIMRNRDSKISNLEVRPVSATSEIFQERVPLDGIKGYGSGGEETERPQFINNLMKPTPGERMRGGGGSTPWDTNRDDCPKIQNCAFPYNIKGEIIWGTKGSKPSSPDTMEGTSGYSWEPYAGEQHSHPANISPIRTLPPPDIPDSLSIVSHDSNNDHHSIHHPFQPITGSRRNLEGLSEDVEYGACALKAGDDNIWPIPHPDAYLLPHGQYSEDEQDPIKPVALRNRYQEKAGSSNTSFHEPIPQYRKPLTEDEINENCSLLCGTPFPAQGPPSALSHTSEPFDTDRKQSSTNSSPRKRCSASSVFPTKYNSRGSANHKHNYSKTTNVTEV